MKRSAGIDQRRHAQQEFELLNSKPKSRNGRKQAREFREGAVTCQLNSGAIPIAI